VATATMAALLQARRLFPNHKKSMSNYGGTPAAGQCVRLWPPVPAITLGGLPLCCSRAASN
jgi:hypothetical protein